MVESLNFACECHSKLKNIGPELKTQILHISLFFETDHKIVESAEVGAQIKKLNAQAQIAQPKFLIDKMQVKIKSKKAPFAQEENKIGKAKIAQLLKI